MSVSAKTATSQNKSGNRDYFNRKNSNVHIKNLDVANFEQIRDSLDDIQSQLMNFDSVAKLQSKTNK